MQGLGWSSGGGRHPSTPEPGVVRSAVNALVWVRQGAGEGAGELRLPAQDQPKRQGRVGGDFRARP